MRRLMQDESGAVAVIAVVLMGLFVMLLALTVDTGQLYHEQRELQNGADAAALAVAFDCARDETTCAATAAGHAAKYASANASDGLSAIDPTSPLPANPHIDFATKQVTVDTRSQEPGQAPEDGVVNFFVPWLDGDDSAAVRARAVAAWGNAIPPKMVPLTISFCDFQRWVSYPTPAPPFRIGPVLITFHDPHGTEGTCDTRPGHDTVDGTGKLSAGFGALQAEPDDACSARTVSSADPAGTWGIKETGNAFQKVLPCLLGKTETPPKDILLPIFVDFCLGNKHCPPEIATNEDGYLLDGYAVFEMTGWRHNNETSVTAPDCGATATTCIQGYFKSGVVSFGQIGTGPYYGVRTAQLTQ